MNQNQIAIPVEVRPEEISRQKTLGDAIALCANVGGYSLDKELQLELSVDKAQFSRWQAGTEGIIWPKFQRLMDACGNDAPLLWMNHQRGWDLSSMRKRQTETEKLLEAERELRKLAEDRLEFITSVVRGKAL